MAARKRSVGSTRRSLRSSSAHSAGRRSRSFRCGGPAERKGAHMTKRKLRPLTDKDEAAIQRQIAADPEDWEATEEDFKNARPFAEVFPDLAESIRRARGRPPVE